MWFFGIAAADAAMYFAAPVMTFQPRGPYD
jgi:hypothetical protein